MPFGWEPRAKDFPRRNRLIAGLSLGLVVIEAANRSGSLISARLAGEMGRLVFAVPGSPLDPRAAGSNGLLKDGAILVTEASDVLDQIAPLAGVQPVRPARAGRAAGFFGDAAARRRTTAPASSKRSGRRRSASTRSSATPACTPAQVFTILLELDLAGRLERHAGGAVSLTYTDG